MDPYSYPPWFKSHQKILRKHKFVLLLGVPPAGVLGGAGAAEPQRQKPILFRAGPLR